MDEDNQKGIYAKYVTCRLCRKKYGLDSVEKKNKGVCPICIARLQGRGSIYTGSKAGLNKKPKPLYTKSGDIQL